MAISTDAARYDDKWMAASWVDALIRLKQEGFKPKRTLKLALTCGEETTYAFNGAEWLAANKRDLIDAAFALNEGGGGRTDGKGVSEGGKLVVKRSRSARRACRTTASRRAIPADTARSRYATTRSTNSPPPW